MSLLKERIHSNIDKFKISDFCPNGGWPKFDNLNVIVYGKEDVKDHIIYDVELLYDCEIAGCCFIPGADNYTRLRKKIKLSETSFEVMT
mgnify:CR=1 FL=1